MTEEPGLMISNELAESFVGLVLRFGMTEPIACYDYDKVIAGYIADGMSEDDAIEHFEYNIIGAWAGERTPCFIRVMPLKQAIEETSDA